MAMQVLGTRIVFGIDLMKLRLIAPLVAACVWLGAAGSAAAQDASAPAAASAPATPASAPHAAAAGPLSQATLAPLASDDFDAKSAALDALLQAAPHDAAARKLLQALQNDAVYVAGASHRLLIQLNRGWEDANGGLLVFFNSNDPADVHRVLRPLHNTGVVFEISESSLHAVTPIQAGDRYTLVLSFFPRAKCSQSVNKSSSV